MSFLSFLGGAVKILIGGAVFVLDLLASTSMMIQGDQTLGVVFLVVALIGGLYAQYERGQQSNRIG